MPERSLAYVWARMLARYGVLWSNAHATAPSAIDEGEWGEAVGGLTEDQIRHGFHIDLDRGSEFPPSSAKFRAMCLPPASDAPRTHLGTAPAKRALSALESARACAAADRELSAMCKKLGIDRSRLVDLPE